MHFAVLGEEGSLNLSCFRYENARIYCANLQDALSVKVGDSKVRSFL